MRHVAQQARRGDEGGDVLGDVIFYVSTLSAPMSKDGSTSCVLLPMIASVPASSSIYPVTAAPVANSPSAPVPIDMTPKLQAANEPQSAPVPGNTCPELRVAIEPPSAPVPIDTCPELRAAITPPSAPVPDNKCPELRAARRQCLLICIQNFGQQ